MVQRLADIRRKSGERIIVHSTQARRVFDAEVQDGVQIVRRREGVLDAVEQQSRSERAPTELFRVRQRHVMILARILETQRRTSRFAVVPAELVGKIRSVAFVPFVLRVKTHRLLVGLVVITESARLAIKLLERDSERNVALTIAGRRAPRLYVFDDTVEKIVLMRVVTRVGEKRLSNKV